ncbi:MAG: peptide ABC transporter substrate-binding protein, partial [Spirochaetia bacterium]|nr:peptide ABC transporter substrate-binding protein [Spirochaetia bacterium]
MRKLLFAMIALLAVVGLSAQDFTIVNGAEPASLDPHAVEGVPEHRIYMALFEGLTVSDPRTNRAIPGIAESWSFSKDYKTITFKLRKGAVWSDGVEITADTVVKSWLRKMDPKNAFQYADLPAMYIAGAMDYLEGKAGPESVKIRAVDKYTFEVQLVGPCPFFADMTTHYAFAIVPIHAIEKYGQDWVKPGKIVSNGPFVLSEWKPQEKIVVVKNNKYWDAKNVALKKVTFIANDDINVGYNLYKTGAADWTETVPLELMDEVKLRKDFHVAPEYGTYYYIFNVTRKPLDDARVRKALAMAINKNDLVNKVTRGGQIPANGFVPPSAGYTPAKGYGYDPETARKLLAEAGYPDGKGFPTLQILYNTSASHKRIAEFIQAQWKDNLGINVGLLNQEWGTYLDTRSQSHNFDMARAGWIGDYLDPSTFLDMWVTGGTQNDGLYSNPKYDELMAKSRVNSGSERYQIMMDAEKVLIDQDMAVLPLYYYVTQNLIDL